MKKRLLPIALIAVLLLTACVLTACASSNCKISFSLGEVAGDPPADISVKTGESVTLPDCQSSLEFEFLGWEAPDHTLYAAGQAFSAKEDVRFVAKWQKFDVFTVTFLADGATVEARKVRKDQPVGALPTPNVASGKRFVKWQAGGVDISADFIVTEDVTAQAVIEDIPPEKTEFEVKFFVESAMVESRTVAKGAPIGPLPEPMQITGFSFVAWQLDGVDISADFIVNDDLNIYALYVSQNAKFSAEFVGSYVLANGGAISLADGAQVRIDGDTLSVGGAQASNIQKTADRTYSFTLDGKQFTLAGGVSDGELSIALGDVASYLYPTSALSVPADLQISLFAVADLVVAVQGAEGKGKIYDSFAVSYSATENSVSINGEIVQYAMPLARRQYTSGDDFHDRIGIAFAATIGNVKADFVFVMDNGAISFGCLQQDEYTSAVTERQQAVSVPDGFDIEDSWFCAANNTFLIFEDGKVSTSYGGSSAYVLAADSGVYFMDLGNTCFARVDGADSLTVYGYASAYQNLNGTYVRGAKPSQATINDALVGEWDSQPFMPDYSIAQGRVTITATGVSFTHLGNLITSFSVIEIETYGAGFEYTLIMSDGSSWDLYFVSSTNVITLKNNGDPQYYSRIIVSREQSYPFVGVWQKGNITVTVTREGQKYVYAVSGCGDLDGSYQATYTEFDEPYYCAFNLSDDLRVKFYIDGDELVCEAISGDAGELAGRYAKSE